jgi:hypothetical protein
MNNRQAGRRRGRGGQRSQGNPNSNSRIDNRQRGNANQLYEKYKNLARDAQMQGDRVNTEYYLQFADHYFRVLNENRSRAEENRRPREDADGESYTDGEFEAEERGREGQRRDRSERFEQPRYEQRMNGRDNGHAESDSDERDEAEPSRQRARRNNGDDRGEASEEQAAEAPVKRGRGRPRKEAAKTAPVEEGAAIDADLLPPSLTGTGAGSSEEEVAKPRRRGRPPKAREATSAAG